MTTEPQPDGDATYRVTLDREACDGVFACLVRDERFVEAADGLATIERGGDGVVDEATEPEVESAQEGADGAATVSAEFGDENADAAQQAAAACPVDAISVEVIDGE